MSKSIASMTPNDWKVLARKDPKKFDRAKKAMTHIAQTNRGLQGRNKVAEIHSRHSVDSL